MTHPLHDRLMARTTVTADGCWLWQGATDRHGYGKVNHQDHTEQVHRIAYKVLGPSFDHALTLDHLCRNTTCWNLAHLEPVSQRENNHRSPLFHVHKTHCPSGHEYTDENTGRDKDGWRRCKACTRNQQRTQRAKKSRLRGV